MAGVRKALIVATDQYSDPKLTRLNAPAEDARALAEVLRDPAVGAYEVDTVLNKTCQEIEIAVASFFQSGARDDTLLVHFSCHGVKDLSGELYFAATDTKLPLLKVTGVASSMVKNAMEESRASLILCLVDCCYSGAFTKSTKAAATVDLTERLGGRGRAVITASTSLQLALDGQEEPSLFTHAVLEGLRSGDADRDLDGYVTLDEFYNYIHEKVTEKNPDQTPVKSFDVQGQVYVARRGGPITTPAPLPTDVREVLRTGDYWERSGAVSLLSDLLSAGHPGRALAARLALEQLRGHDDSNKVREAAAKALADAGDPKPMPPIPPYDGTQTIHGNGGTDPGESGEDPTGRRGNDNGGGGWLAGRSRAAVAAAAAVAAVLVGGWGVVQLTGDDDGRSGDTFAPTDPGVGGALPPSELLMIITDDAGIKRLTAVDVRSGLSRTIKQGVALPTLSSKREEMFYLQKKGAGDVAYKSNIDGRSGIKLVLNPRAESQCPFSGRPAESSSGGHVALVCKDESGSVIGLFFGEWNGGTEIEGLNQRAEDAWPTEAPTWQGDDHIVFVSADFEDGRTILRRVPREGGDSERITDDGSGWDSHPDWSDEGLLFLRSPDKGKKGDVWRLNPHTGRQDQLTTDGDAQSPTWSPDGREFAFLAPAPGDDQLALWIQEARVGASAKPITITDKTGAEVVGKLGPPAWGTR